MTSDPKPPARPANPFAALVGKVGRREPAEPAEGSGSEPKPALRPNLTAPAGAQAKERVTVRRERAGRGGKTVTLAEGPGLRGLDLEALAREAARGLGTGARVEDRCIVVQGDQSDRLVAWLGARGFANVARGN